MTSAKFYLTAALIITVSPALAVLEDDADTAEIPQVSAVKTSTDTARLQQAHDLLRNDQFRDAQDILRTLDDESNTTALAYWGYSHRKLGNIDIGLDFYARALKADPNNLLARSYLGEAFVEMNALLNAREQLQEIRARGGKGSAAEQRLIEALDGNKGTGYGQ